MSHRPFLCWIAGDRGIKGPPTGGLLLSGRKFLLSVSGLHVIPRLEMVEARACSIQAGYGGLWEHSLSKHPRKLTLY